VRVEVGATAQLTNKSIELMVTLLMVYMIVEFNKLPNGCEQVVHAVCIAAYASGGK
jgi:hypothetical protein